MFCFDDRCFKWLNLIIRMSSECYILYNLLGILKFYFYIKLEYEDV